MAAVDVDQYFSHEARLASFQKSSKKRGSTASGRGKALNWPHKQIAPASLAKAGFYFDPSPDSPDNVVCFLCNKGLDGWESGDDPLLEHLKHASHCGWAVVAAIEAEIGDYEKADPGQPHMVEARKATFAGRWPHDGKKGWKCKTKQLVDSGWKYTPTAESDDMATCAYCQLALDGWEPSDKPYDEHYKRSPDCAFFALMIQFEGAPRKKTGQGKAARGSKASRLSAQSVATVASDALSVADVTADVEDSVLTTTSTRTQGGRKTKGKKGASAKGSRNKAKQNETVETEVVDQSEEVALEPQPVKASRGKKRGSETIDDSVMFISEGPAAKKRATRTRSSTVTNASTVIPDDSGIADAPGPARKNSARNKGRGSNAKSRAISTISTASMASLRKPTCDFPDDEEIERQLQADLEREWSEDDEIAQDSECEANRTNGDIAAQSSADYAMFDPTVHEPDDADVEEELRALQAAMAVDEQEQLHVPKKGRKAGTRKASKQTKSKKSRIASPPPEPEPEIPEPEIPELPAEEPAAESHDVSVQSTDTVVKNAEAAQATRGRGKPTKFSLASRESLDAVEEPPVQPPVKRGRGRPSKASLASRASASAVELVEPVKPVEPVQQPAKRGRGRPSKASLVSQASDGGDETKSANAPAKRGRGRPLKKTRDSTEAQQPQPATTVDEAEVDDEVDVIQTGEEVEEGRTTPPVALKQTAPPRPVLSSRHLAEPPSTPAKVVSPAPSARQPAISPSPSPQSSDAENQPPSSKPTTSATAKRVVLAQVVETPIHSSPSKRNVLAGLQSTTPWTTVNLDAVIGTPRAGVDKENAVGRLLKQGKEMTSPEKRMTVEEWIYFNAGEAEKKLKHECETMVNQFEREGTRAMNVLEGLSAE
ncbi:Protein bir1 [Tolypocladium ophioglossoides CBS 100239]|uniref:Protein bir1 n=1 Tax=Tolypocladium ophioglossoides (strain CBS 100239) TaxID=1163406 RepID=A0A0L0N426_TOLOC|nr:Protein bir1 [Tolypocladium ophioglossoides CBS 100239]